MTIGAFNVQTAKRVLSAVNQVEAGVSNGTVIRDQQGSLYRTPQGGIPANESAECTQLWFGSGNELIEMPDANGAAIQRTVYNVFSGDIGGDSMIVVLRMYGRLVAIAEDCSG